MHGEIHFLCLHLFRLQIENIGKSIPCVVIYSFWLSLFSHYQSTSFVLFNDPVSNIPPVPRCNACYYLDYLDYFTINSTLVSLLFLRSVFPLVPGFGTPPLS